MVGERILGRFVCEERLGSGGFGTVYRAWDERLHRAVAVKVVERPGDAGRVAREAQAAARLTHRNIATLYELAVQGDRAYLVGELVEGDTLRQLGRRGELSDRAVAEVGAGAAAALSHAHRQGVVHRDVKPDNLLVPEAGGPAKLVDFGIARVAGEATLTATGSVLGTLAYMAPEQADGLRPGPAADVYSLAITLYECWAGEHPLAGPGPAATARAIGEPVPSLREVRPDLPIGLIELIDAGLDPDPEQRPLASELEAVLYSQAPDLSGDPLPPLAGPAEPDEGRAGRSLPVGARVAGAASLAAAAATVLVWSDATALPLLAIPVLTGVVALGRPRAGLAAGALATAAWLAIGAGDPGAALILLLLVAPLLLVPIEPGPTLSLPSLAPLLGAIGLGGAYPALASLPAARAERALLGGVGYLWLVAAEVISGRQLLLGVATPAPPGWSGSVDTALSEVVAALLSPAVLAGAALWALAAVTLPLVVRGRFGALDLIGGILWTAALVSGERLLAGSGGAPGGLLAQTVLGVVLVVAITRRARIARRAERLLHSARHASPAAESA